MFDLFSGMFDFSNFDVTQSVVLSLFLVAVVVVRGWLATSSDGKTNAAAGKDKAVAAASPPPPPPARVFACLACGEDFKEGAGLVCEEDPEGHSLCDECTESFVSHACNHALLVDGKVPLRCSMPACSKPFDHNAVVASVRRREKPELVALYEKKAIEAALFDDAFHRRAVFEGKNESGEFLSERPVVCHHCNQYARIVYMYNERPRGAPRQDDADLDRRLRALEVNEERELRLAVNPADVEAEMDREVARALRPDVDFSGLANLWEPEEEADDDEETSVFGNFFEPIFPECGEMTPEKRAEITARYEAQFAPRIEAAKQQRAEIAARFAEERETIEAERAERDKKRAAWADLTSHWKRVSDSDLTESTRFLCCETDGCEGVICVRCCATVPLEATYNPDDHVCFGDRVAAMFDELEAILTEGSVQRCPGCGKAGQKDLNCCHIGCDGCGVSWCYVCAQQFNDFSEHNNPGGVSWTLEHYKPPPIDPADDSVRCPMYLQYAFGDDGPNDGRRNGDPALALRRFHLIKQKRALDEFMARPDVDAEVFAAMTTQYFPDGILDEQELTKLREMELL